MNIKYKLLALFDGAKTEGEKKAALNRLEHICLKEGIDVDEFLKEQSKQEIISKTITIEKREHLKLFVQIIYVLYPNEFKNKKISVYAPTRFIKYDENVEFKGTSRQFMEVKYAFDVYFYNYKSEREKLLKKQNKERKNFFESFLYANELFPKNSASEKTSKTKKDILEILRQSKNINKTNLNKPLNKGEVNPEPKMLN